MSAGVGASAEMQTEESTDVANQLRVMRQLIGRLTSLNLDPTEYACLKAIVLFKPGNLAFICTMPASFEILFHVGLVLFVRKNMFRI